MGSRFDWCVCGQHDRCRVQYRAVKVDDRGRHRSGGQTVRCACPCHQSP